MRPPLTGKFNSEPPPRDNESMLDVCADIIADFRPDADQRRCVCHLDLHLFPFHGLVRSGLTARPPARYRTDGFDLPRRPASSCPRKALACKFLRGC